MRNTPALAHLVQPLRIVAVTAYDDMDNMTAAKKAGIQHVYSKPMTIQGLEEAVEGLGIANN